MQMHVKRKIILENNIDNTLAFMAYKCIRENVRLRHDEIEINNFLDEITREFLIDCICKNKVIASGCYAEDHGKFNLDIKEKLLLCFIYDKDLLKRLLIQIKYKIHRFFTAIEYKILIPYILSFQSDLFKYFKDVPKFQEPKFIKSLKLSEEQQQKMDSLMILYNLC